MSAIPRELQHFLLLSPDEQAQAIRRLDTLGWSAETISRATRLSVEQIALVLTPPPSKCARTGIPASFCTCIGPHA